MHSLELEKVKLKVLFRKYQLEVNQIIERELPSLGCDSRLKEACLYALQGDAKRFRPAIVLIISKLLQSEFDSSLAALSIEVFHTASLIADDLPCMDDDSFRRSKAALHKEYGTDVALLASYALIGMGYECVLKLNRQLEKTLPDSGERAFIAMEFLAKNNGLNGAPTGQYQDLYPPKMSESVLFDVLYKKTVIFFETAFLFGWLFNGGSLDLTDKVQKAGFHFGMAFQIYDDFCDYEQDQKKGKLINTPLYLGRERGVCILNEHIESCKQLLQQLGLLGEEFSKLLDYLSEKATR